MSDVVQTPARAPGAGPTLVDYILDKVGAAPASSQGPAEASGSLVDYILQKTSGGAAKNGSAVSGSVPSSTPETHVNGNGNGALIAEKQPKKGKDATSPTLQDWILQKTNGKPQPEA